MTKTSVPASYFDALYAADPDPWRFASSEYERTKYAATLAALPAARFGSALEVGCSIGVLTRQLAGRCDRLLSLDVSDAALLQARARCSGLASVTLRRMRVPDEWPVGTFDLLLFSEVLYFLSPDDVARTAVRARRSLADGGTILLVNYILPTDNPCSGDDAAEIFIRSAGLAPRLQQRNQAYRLDRLHRGQDCAAGP